MQHVQFGSQKISFHLLYLNRKSLGIKVHPDGTVKVLAPINAKEADVFKMVKAKAPWILKQLHNFNGFRPPTPPRRFVSGETHLYLGRQYRLKIVPATINDIKVYRGQLWIYAIDISRTALKLQLYRWYKEKAAGVFNELLEEVIPTFKKYKIKIPHLAIRTMSKRWGSCTPSGKIILNTELIKAPKGSIEYVIIHELCHLIHRNHTKPFFNLLNKMSPEWQKWKNRLEYSLN